MHKLADDGLSIVVHNGSTLFSGDAGSGESNIRKHFFEKDWVEAIVQMPTDEFFNTGIYTYLWIFNKNKPADRKDKVILINASELYVPLKKSKGKKRKEMDLTNRTKIVKALTEFKDCHTEQGRSIHTEQSRSIHTEQSRSIAKVFDKWHFYYNRQSIMLTNIDENGNSIEMPVKTSKDGEEKGEKSIKLTPTKITQESLNLDLFDFGIDKIDTTKYKTLEDYFENYLKPLLAELDYKEKDLKVYTDKMCYWYDADKDSIAEAEIHKSKFINQCRLDKLFRYTNLFQSWD